MNMESSAGGSSDSFFDEYQAISNKLKKRFLRKPNVSEAAEEFGRLGDRLKQAELSEYAGLSQLARARCQATLGAGAPAQADALLAAARCFLQAHRDQTMGGGGGSGPLTVTVSLYDEAIRQLTSCRHGLLAARASLQLADQLQRLGRPAQALPYFQDAAELQAPPASLESRRLAVECQLELGDLQAALISLDDMRSSLEELTGGPASGVGVTYLRWCEVCQLLLLLALELPTSQLKPAHTRLLESVSPTADPRRRGGLAEEPLHLLLQSLCLAVRRRRPAALRSLEGQLRHLLDEPQRHLLGQLVSHVEAQAPAHP